jgi:hypothetical protein
MRSSLHRHPTARPRAHARLECVSSPSQRGLSREIEYLAHMPVYKSEVLAVRSNGALIERLYVGADAPGCRGTQISRSQRTYGRWHPSHLSRFVPRLVPTASSPTTRMPRSTGSPTSSRIDLRFGSAVSCRNNPSRSSTPPRSPGCTARPAGGCTSTPASWAPCVSAPDRGHGSASRPLASVPRSGRSVIRSRGRYLSARSHGGSDAGAPTAPLWCRAAPCSRPGQRLT